MCKNVAPGDARPKELVPNRVHRPPVHGPDRFKTARRFPPPWSAEDIGAAIVVKDAQKWNL
jgi:hypothetical protein